MEKTITKEMIKQGYEQEFVCIRDSSMGDGVVCYIGNNWFYFGGLTGEESTAEEYVTYVPKEDIIDEIYDSLDELRTELPDEYLYYYLYLKQQLAE